MVLFFQEKYKEEKYKEEKYKEEKYKEEKYKKNLNCDNFISASPVFDNFFSVKEI